MILSRTLNGMAKELIIIPISKATMNDKKIAPLAESLLPNPPPDLPLFPA
jgi:hypothetical protein